ncbi:CBS domain-containing protein [Paraliomyxa miuraensis]|uniref:CBS domain-containing protein n=1 Tax=Paraliomyxa miuraensis TaxID=376150 RepID=UPI002256E60C|nr:CBS domain-containing protein [Paraliomyxa miuraensis]MCX4246599.1 CBS domain-containing protein [Paraliomyxa miuraensis]
MTLHDRTISEIMSDATHSIGDEQPMSEAAYRMHKHGIRHLPVLRGGRLVGIVSDRDLAMVESLPGIDPNEVSVGEAMTSEPYAVPPGASLPAVLREMAEHKYGTAVVVEDDRVVGIVTTTDALRLCVDLLVGGGR